MYEIKDLTNLKWGTTHNGGISYGCYYKATDVQRGRKVYYKCSNYYAGYHLFDDESINEVIISRLLNKLGIPCVKYTLELTKVSINGLTLTTYVCKSPNFFTGYDSRMKLEDLHSMYNSITVDELISKFGLQDSIKHMIIADFITIQRDRHGGNIEILEKNGKLTVSPLFDNGCGLLAPYPSSMNTVDISNFDVLKDYPVNNYIGTKSLYQNLRYVDKPIKVNRLRKNDKASIFYNLNGVLPQQYINKIWQIIVYRYMFLRQKGYINDSEV